MALWEVARLPGHGNEKVRLRYHNLITGRVYDLGGVGSDIPDSMILDWIFNWAENLTPGDWVRLSDGRLLRYLRERGRS